MVIKRYLVDWVFCEECETGEYVRYKDHAAEVSRLEYELEKARTANMVHIADADLYRQAELARHERDAALAEVARMRPVVESAVEIHNGPEYCDEALLDKYYNALDNYMAQAKKG